MLMGFCFAPAEDADFVWAGKSVLSDEPKRTVLFGSFSPHGLPHEDEAGGSVYHLADEGGRTACEPLEGRGEHVRLLGRDGH